MILSSLFNDTLRDSIFGYENTNLLFKGFRSQANNFEKKKRFRTIFAIVFTLISTQLSNLLPVIEIVRQLHCL